MSARIYPNPNGSYSMFSPWERAKKDMVQRARFLVGFTIILVVATLLFFPLMIITPMIWCVVVAWTVLAPLVKALYRGLS